MKKSKLIHKFKVTVSMCLIVYVDLFIGCATVFSAVILAQLNEPSSSLKVNKEEASWIASIMTLVCPVGYIFFGPFMDSVGRKKALCFTYLLIMLSWLTFAFADSYYTILIGRVLQGFTVSAVPCTYAYAVEICRVEQRQLFSAIVNLFVGVGMTVQCVLAMFFHWHTISVIMLAMSGVGCASLFLLPESPAWLRARGRLRQAEAAERWYGTEPAVDVRADRGGLGHENGPTPAARSRWSVYTHRTVWKPTLIIMTMFACMQLSGLYVLITYSGYVLHGFNVPWDSITVTALLCVARVLGGLVFSALHGVKRATLFVVSSVGMATSLIVVLLLSGTSSSANFTFTNFVLVTAFFAYEFSSLLGILPLPWILCSELFPRVVTGTMSSFVQICHSLMMFVIIKIYPMLELHFGIYVIWSVFTMFCIISALLGIFILPETKGKSLDEIAMMFEKCKKIANDN